MKNKILILSTIIVAQLSAITFTGIGYGNTKDELKKNALSDLSQNISTQVQSNFKTITSKLDGEYSKDITNVVELKSSLPIKAAKFLTKNDTLVASISTKDSLNGYLTKKETEQQEK